MLHFIASTCRFIHMYIKKQYFSISNVRILLWEITGATASQHWFRIGAVISEPIQDLLLHNDSGKQDTYLKRMACQTRTRRNYVCKNIRKIVMYVHTMQRASLVELVHFRCIVFYMFLTLSCPKRSADFATFVIFYHGEVCN